MAESKEIQVHKNISDQVLARINAFEEEGSIKLPSRVVVENSLKSAYLMLQEQKDKNGKPVLESCTTSSIANCLLSMCLQGLSPDKKQCYFVAYGNNLTLMRSYMGTMALAKRVGGVQDVHAQIVYKGDEFEYTIDPQTGITHITKHVQKIGNVDNANIVAAYAVIKYENGFDEACIMTMQQIQAAWNQGQTKGQSPAHKNFKEEMAKKTVIGRACKLIVNGSDDAWILDGSKDEDDNDNAAEQRTALIHNTPKDMPEDVDYEDVDPENTHVDNPPAEPAQEQNPSTGGDLFGGEDAPY